MKKNKKHNLKGILRAMMAVMLSCLMIIPVFGAVEAKAAVKEYLDVTYEYAPAYVPIYWASWNGIAFGYSNGYFGPEDSCSREQFVVMLWRMMGKQSASSAVKFSDISSSRNTCKAIQWAVANNIIKGYNDGTFKPTATVTRQQVAVMLWRMAGKPTVSFNVEFEDISPNDSTYRAMQWGSAKAITKGYADMTFRPTEDCQRQHVAIFLYRYAKNILGWDVSKNANKYLPEKSSTIKEDKTVCSHKYTETVTRPASCKEEGVKTFVCSICGETKTETISKTNNHSWDNGTVTRQATCSADGVRAYTCEVCGATRTETIAKTSAHNWDNGVVKTAATCASTGTKVYTCKACGKTKTETIPKTNEHSWNSGVVYSPASCIYQGSKTYTCTVCGASKTETTPALGHNWQTTTEYKDAYDEPVYELIPMLCDACREKGILLSLTSQEFYDQMCASLSEERINELWEEAREGLEGLKNSEFETLRRKYELMMKEANYDYNAALRMVFETSLISEHIQMHYQNGDRLHGFGDSVEITGYIHHDAETVTNIICTRCGAMK